MGRFWQDACFVRSACDVLGTLLLDSRVPTQLRDDPTIVRAAARRPWERLPR